MKTFNRFLMLASLALGMIMLLAGDIQRATYMSVNAILFLMFANGWHHD